ncbi:MAG: DUF4157 domain-containing protein [Pirellulales bacterium]
MNTHAPTSSASDRSTGKTIDPLGSNHQPILSHSIPTLSSPLRLQTKLTVNTPGDAFEQEADRVAEQVMCMPEPSVQRKVNVDRNSVRGGNSTRNALIGTIQRVANSATLDAPVPSIVNQVLSSPGTPLPAPTRSFMESRFGQDFSQVRIHTDQRAADSAAAVNARAYTVGSNVVFGPGESPMRDSRLLAHELTHVVQQRDSATVTPTIQRDFSLKWMREKKAELVQRAKRELNEIEGTIAAGAVVAKEQAHQVVEKVRDTVAKVETEIHAFPDKATAAVKEVAADVRKEVKAKVTQVATTVNQAKAKVGAKTEGAAKVVKQAAASAFKEVKKQAADGVMEKLGTLKGVLLEGANILDTILWLRGIADEWSEAGIRKAYQAAIGRGMKIPFSEAQIITGFRSFTGLGIIEQGLEKAGLAKRDPETGQLSTAKALSDSMDERANALEEKLGASKDGVFTAYERGELIGAVGTQVGLAFIGVEEVQLALKGLNALASVKSLVAQCKPGWETSLSFWITFLNMVMGFIGLKSGAASKKVVQILTQGGALAGLIPPLRQLFADYNDPELAKNEEQHRKKLSKDWDAVCRGFAMIAFSVIHGKMQDKSGKDSIARGDANLIKG